MSSRDNENPAHRRPNTRGRSPIPHFLISLFFPPLASIMLLASQTSKGVGREVVLG